MLARTLAAAAITASLATGATAVIQEESPDYTILKETDGVQLRLYAPYVVAEVDVKADNRRMASSMGFGPLASYIFGRNRPGEKIAMTSPVTTKPVTMVQGIARGGGEKIAMTSPVTTAETREGFYTVRFAMPKDYTLKTLPKPQDDRVRLMLTEERQIIASGYTGPRDSTRDDKINAALEAFATAKGLALTPGMITAGYDGPATPAEERRWEIMREVATN